MLFRSEKGLYRHAIGGSSVEQIIEGSLSSLFDPKKEIVSMIELDNYEFMALYSNGRLVRFVYDEQAQATPSNKLKIYSLYENEYVKQVITAYQTKYPECFVEYEVGIEIGSSVTRDDALKAINTKVIAGEGPDLFVMDKMPMESYMEKGMLADLSNLINQNNLFKNVISTMQYNDTTYMIPAKIQMPVVLGKQEEIGKAQDFETVANAIVAIGEKNPKEDVIGMYTEEGVLQSFSKLFALNFTNEDGTLNTNTIRKFLESTQTIYEVQKNASFPNAKVLEGYEKEQLNDKEYILENYYYYNLINPMSYAMGDRLACFGTINSSFGLNAIHSLNRKEGLENSDYLPLKINGEIVVVPNTLLAISSKTDNQKMAIEFLDMALGEEMQSVSTETGLPMNKTAFMDNLKPKAESQEAIGSMNSSTFGGKRFDFDIYAISEQQYQRFFDYVEKAAISYVQDITVEEVIFEQGASYLDGSKSLEEVLKEIQDRLALYLSE